MSRIRFSGAAALALAAAATFAPPALAQNEVVAQPNPEADRLANEIRVLAEDPRNVRSLLTAGELSAQLNDTSAALAFFARAEAIEPTNPRIAAGRARALVRLERPGEALRLFQLAEAGGVPAVEYAADRALAYDLLGAPQLAQRDYKMALARDRDDETVRRYALSLGVTGDVDEAMRELDSLLRRRDRAAWRARAFIMAMNGDFAGAEKIAASMMPGNMGLALTPFFRRLGGLSPADRAFAVHFGGLKPSAARLADASLAPALPAYVPQPRKVEVAAVAPPPAVAEKHGRDRRSRRQRQADEREAAARRQVAALAAQRQAPPTPVPLPSPPVFEPARTAAIVQPLPTPTPTPVREPPVEIVQPTPTPAPPPAPAPVEVAAAPVQPDPEPVQVAQGGPVAAVPSAVSTAAASPPVSAPASSVGSEDSRLAAIIESITIPASELGIEPMPGAVVATPPPAPVLAEPDPAPVRVAASTPVETVPEAKAVAKPKPAPAPAKPAKKPPAKPDPAKAEPSRVWVQVAGGADEKSLGLTWKKLVKQAPAAFKGKTAWTTPLRATNRILAGPFKNAKEAQGFVNLLRSESISAFVFTSTAGQKIARLAVK